MNDTSKKIEITDALIDELLVGAVDLHCHSGPSVMPRQIDHIEAMEEASAAKMRAILFKDHYYSVAPITELMKAHYSDRNVELLSGVPCNNTSGGLNPYAVDHGLNLGARLVWMPTFSAANHIRHTHRRKLLPTKMDLMKPTALTVVDPKGDILDEVKVILDQIAKHDCVLSGGHLHISEIWPLFEEAKQRGVKRLLVNHPTFVIDASLSDITELAEMGAYIEHSMCMFIDGSRFQHFPSDELQDVVKAGGVDRTILGSDLGQVKAPRPVEGFKLVIRLCLEFGYTPEEIRKLIGLNACQLMGIDPAVEMAAE
ncbi:MAG: hypothetical protein ISR52_07960 [Rhodospirillales bacterium]|nr:hypothetical protein [Rhodospirillales bacterium]